MKVHRTQNNIEIPRFGNPELLTGEGGFSENMKKYKVFRYRHSIGTSEAAR